MLALEWMLPSASWSLAQVPHCHRPACCLHLAQACCVAWTRRQCDTRLGLPGCTWPMAWPCAPRPPCLWAPVPAGARPLALPGGLGAAICARPLVWGCRLGALGCHRGRLSAPGLTKLKPLTSQPGGPSMVGLAPFRIPARSANHSFLARSANGWALHRRHVCGYKRSILVLCMGGVQAPHGPPPPFLLHARVRCKRALGVNSKCGAPIYINFLFRLIYESNITSSGDV